MSTENTADLADLEEAAFMAGFNGEALPATAPAEAAPAPAGVAEAVADEPAPEVVDEYAGLSPKVREQLSQLESLRQAASLIPTLEHRLRSAEGRVAALQKSVPAPTPPAPERLEKVETLRGEWPEVIEAMEEMLQRKPAQKADEQPATQQEAVPVESETYPLLDEEMPGWGPKMDSPQFRAWLASQGADYERKVKTTNTEGVALAALVKFDAHQDLARQRADAAAKAASTRQARASAAVTPETAGRREPVTSSLEDAFVQGFNTRR